MDKRYKLDNKKLKVIRQLRDDGVSLNRIAKLFDISGSTIYYWTNDKYRKEKRKKNAKRINCNKRRTKLLIAQKKMFVKEVAIQYIKKQIENYQYLTKEKDVLILGISMREHWIPYIKENYDIKKLDENREPITLRQP